LLSSSARAKAFTTPEQTARTPFTMAETQLGQLSFMPLTSTAEMKALFSFLQIILTNCIRHALC
jgi:hypothetical protein